MEYFSEAHFRAITNRMSLYEQRTYSDNYQGLPMNEQFDIFLSYNISDSDVVKGIFYAYSVLRIDLASSLLITIKSI